MVEERVPKFIEEDKRRRTARGRKPSKLRDVVSGETGRIDTGINELNRVLGGGPVPGSLTLVWGEPGIGKSTLIIQVAARIVAAKGKVLYVSGEESEEQIKMRLTGFAAENRK